MYLEISMYISRYLLNIATKFIDHFDYISPLIIIINSPTFKLLFISNYWIYKAELIWIKS